MLGGVRERTGEAEEPLLAVPSVSLATELRDKTERAMRLSAEEEAALADTVGGGQGYQGEPLSAEDLGEAPPKKLSRFKQRLMGLD